MSSTLATQVARALRHRRPGGETERDRGHEVGLKRGGVAPCLERAPKAKQDEAEWRAARKDDGNEGRGAKERAR